MTILQLRSYDSHRRNRHCINNNQNAQHCFLLDGKTVLPLNSKSQLFIPIKIVRSLEKPCCQCRQSNLLDETDSCSIKSINRSVNLLSNQCQIKRSDYCKHYSSDQQMINKKNNFHKYLTNSILPSINFTIDPNKMTTNQSATELTITIKPFSTNRNQSKEKIFEKKRRYSSTSLKTANKRLLSYQSDQVLSQHRLSTFKDISRKIHPTESATIHRENLSSNIFKKNTLFNIYRKRKQELIRKL